MAADTATRSTWALRGWMQYCRATKKMHSEINVNFTLAISHAKLETPHGCRWGTALARTN